MSDDLVKRLRSSTQFYHADCELKMACANHIEELEAENKRFNEQMDAIEEMGTESLNALPDCLMRLAPALVENGELKAKLERAECLLVDAMVQLGNGKIKLRRECAYLIGKFLAELKGESDE